jgi:molecular chaperone GrpE (heat shock protein)
MPEASATPPAPESTPPPAPEQATATPHPAAEGAAPLSPEQQRIAELEARAQQAEAALADERDKFLRKVADFENTRRRITSDAQRTAEARDRLHPTGLSFADNRKARTTAATRARDHLSAGVA